MEVGLNILFIYIYIIILYIYMYLGPCPIFRFIVFVLKSRSEVAPGVHFLSFCLLIWGLKHAFVP